MSFRCLLDHIQYIVCKSHCLKRTKNLIDRITDIVLHECDFFLSHFSKQTLSSDKFGLLLNFQIYVIQIHRKYRRESSSNWILAFCIVSCTFFIDYRVNEYVFCYSINSKFTWTLTRTKKRLVDDHHVAKLWEYHTTFVI